MNKSEMWRSQGMEEHMTKEKVSAWSWMIRMSPEVGFVHRGAIEDFYLFFFPGEYRKIYFEEGYTRRNVISLRRYFH